MINTTTLKSALVSTILMGILAVLGYIISLGDIFLIDWKVMANIGIMAIFTGAASLIKNYLTNEQTGVFAGIVKITSPKT